VYLDDIGFVKNETATSAGRGRWVPHSDAEG